MVLAGVIPITELVEERCETFKKNKAAKKEERIKTLERWERTWRDSPGGEWTKENITNLRKWVERKSGNLSYHLTQALTGHGCFGTYLQRIKNKDPSCWYCGAIDTPQHTIRECREWTPARSKVERDTGMSITMPLSEILLSSKKNWTLLEDYITNVMKSKENKELREDEQNMAIQTTITT